MQKLNSKKRLMTSQFRKHQILFNEILTRLFLLLCLTVSHFLIHPFIRVIQPEEWWYYQNPVKPDTIPVYDMALQILWFSM